MVTPSAQLTVTEVSAVLALNDAAFDSDGSAPLGEASQLGLHEVGTHLQHHIGAELVGYAQVRTSGESALLVHPDHRRNGIGAKLAHAALEHGAGYGWAPGSHPGAAALARCIGWQPSRTLHAMTRHGLDELPPLPLPIGVELRAFRPGIDDAEWLGVNARAFAALPDQGGWTEGDLAARLELPWFDASDFLLAVDPAIVGFHWTKRTSARRGEIYVVGVDPSWQGRGLGKVLTVAGLMHLRERGVNEVSLYVDAVNTPARALYDRLGFTEGHRDTEYSAT